MATPWTTSVKNIDLSSNSKHANPNVPVSAGFTPPQPVSPLSCGPQALFTAMAKAQALRNANPAIVAALERSATALVEAIVDDAGNRFDLTPEADMLESTVRRALSGSVGAGVCHLYMTGLGYVWQDFAASVISTTGKLADFAYDGGPASGHGIVLAEAKGSFSDKVDPIQMKNAADSAYKKQVDGHIAGWTSNGSGQVVHGYAIAFGAQPDAVRKTASPPHAMVHLAETAPMQPVATSSPPHTGGGAAAANAALALGNYRAAFMLARAPLVVDAIDLQRTGRPLAELPDYQVFDSFKAGGREFWTGAPSGHRNDRAYRDLIPAGGGVFAVEATVARRLLDALSWMMREMAPGTVGSQPVPLLELPVLRPQLIAEGQTIWFPDGLASAGKFDFEKQLRWSPTKGIG